jgi:two-component system NtrC family sensor kinase
MIVHLGLLLGGSLLMGLVAIVGVNGVHDDLNVALQGNQQLRQVYQVGLEVSTAKRNLNGAHSDASAALSAIESALVQLDRSDFDGPNRSPNWLDESKKADCRSGLQAAALQLKSSNDRDAQASAVNAVLGQLANLSAEVRKTIEVKQSAAEAQRHRTLEVTIVLFAMVVLTAIVIGIRQYRSVMIPLGRIGTSVRNFTAGRLDERITPAGDHEFVSLASDFNRMASELETLYRQLEEKVAAKSKELVRAQRLASVGYLAAGVAHEMNNPLGIIAGYGERSLQHLSRPTDDTTLPSAQRAIKIMCEEAFRCKEITARLLSLARPAANDRQAVSLGAITQEIISNLGGLPEYADRRITLESPAAAELFVMAKEGEIRQVLMNLLLNALQATSPGTGKVYVSIVSVRTKCGSEVEISVRDNGCGMTPDTVDRVFEPFFTDKRGRQQPGTGLGLSITHAIVLDHGGRISAQSDGPGRGSQFTLALPAANKGEIVASNG